ncbi:hypothetical protein E8E13_002341 [Curvularia kusanoi]|uniref:Uncharacterized protein n=1 Tax=Curvularia kusanoi TaxID=90978 RepID=A0A9P4TGM5_CURKU|nr:hypothetical protein E8E13_002341 [Curvularia kusanoi]
MGLLRTVRSVGTGLRTVRSVGSGIFGNGGSSFSNGGSSFSHGGSTQQLDSDNMDKLTRICNRLKKHCPTNIMVSDGRLREIDNDMISRLLNGGEYTASTWRMLLDLLVLPAAKELNIFVTTGDQLPPVVRSEVFVWIHEISANGTSFPRMSWCITVCKPYEHYLKTYAVGHMHDPQRFHAQIADTLKIPKASLSSFCHRETTSTNIHYAFYSDAVLFDMLLDIIIGEFQAHRRSLNDGTAFQLEILQAIEKAHTAAQYAKNGFMTAATIIANGNTGTMISGTRVHIGDRLKKKDLGGRG